MKGEGRTVRLCMLAGLLTLCFSPALAQKLPPLPLDDDPVEEVQEEAEVPAEEVQEEAEPLPVPLAPPSARTPVCETLFTGEPEPRIKRRVKRVLESKHLVGARVGIVAVAYPEGVLLFEQNGNELFNPASVVKLFTAAGAMLTLGIDRRFETAVLASPGDCPRLYLKGGGDPGLSTEDLEKLAHKLKVQGLSCVHSVTLDLSLFDAVTLAPCYDQKESDSSWRPRIGALGVSNGAFAVRVSPGGFVGAAPSVRVEPSSDCFVVDNRGLTVDLPDKEGVRVETSLLNGKVVVKVTGKVGTTEEKGVLFLKALPEPDRFAGCYFVEKLAQSGVEVQDSKLEFGVTPGQAARLAAFTSEPLATDLKRMQLRSLNFVAEQVLKLMAPEECRPATFDCGLTTLRTALAGLGLHPSCMELGNGSGLFEANKVTPAQVVRLLVEMANRGELAQEYINFLPVSGVSGTLRQRMKRLKNRVKAKTGTLDTVSAMAGYATRDDGGKVIFAILFNNATASRFSLRSVQDRIVEVLLGWSSGRRHKR